MNLTQLFSWTGRIIGIVAVIGSLYSFSFLLPLFALLVVALVLVATLIVAWINEAIGGPLLIIVASILFVVVLGTEVPIMYLTYAALYFLSGAVFLGDYLYRERQEQKGDEI